MYERNALVSAPSIALKQVQDYPVLALKFELPSLIFAGIWAAYMRSKVLEVSTREQQSRCQSARHCQPAAIGPEYFREDAVVVNAAVSGPPGRDKMVEIMRRHGLNPAP